MENTSLYDQDYSLWLEKTAYQLSQGHWNEVDVLNLIEEIQSLGRSEKHALKNQLIRVMMHMLKWDYQPGRRSRSWILSIVQGQGQISDLLNVSPSLVPYLESSLVSCYRQAVKEASAETGLPPLTFPENCPYTSAEIFSREFEL